MSLQENNENQQEEENQQDADGQESGSLTLQDSPELQKAIQDAFAEMEGIDEQRDELNAEANEIRAKLKNKGIPTKAFNAAYARYKLDEDKREKHDIAFAICANAVGVGYQSDLFKNNVSTVKH